MSSKPFKPLLAETAEDLNALQFPLVASPKLDGIRCVILDAKAVSRKLKDIPNDIIREALSRPEFNGLDGELICGPVTAPDVMQASTSGVMGKDATSSWTYYVFDCFNNPDSPYADRLEEACAIVKQSYSAGRAGHIKIVQTALLASPEMLMQYEQDCVDAGYEGVMVRSLFGRYKYGRSTVKEGILLKIKRFADGEAIILDASPEMQNNNAPEKDNLGNTKRSTTKAGKVATDTLGTLHVKDLETNIEFDIGTIQGGTDAYRKALWEMHKQGQLAGKIFKYKHQPSGQKDKPRFPVGLGFRDLIDM